MSFLLIAAAAAAFAGAAGFFAARRASRREEGSSPPALPMPGAAPVTPAAPPRFATSPLQVGEVVVRDREERWLTGAIVVEEGSELVAVVFAAPDGGNVGFVASFPAPRRDILWLERVGANVGAEPPTSFEWGGVLMQRVRRLPVQLRRVGEGAPDLQGDAIFAEYAASDLARAVLLFQGDRSLGLSGKLLEPSAYEVLGSGGEVAS